MDTAELKTKPTRRWDRLTASLVFLLAFALFVPTLFHDFVWDDLQITVDSYIHESSHWPEVLTFRTLDRDIIDNNRPAMLLTLMADAAIWGLKPFGYHLTNNLLHGANAALLCLLAYRALRLRGRERLFRSLTEISASGKFVTTGSNRNEKTRNRWLLFVTAAAAMLFAVHPLVVEPISVVCFREDVQSTFFTLASLWLASRLDETPLGRFGTAARDSSARRLTRTAVIAGVWLMVFLAIATKENGIAAPVLLCAWAILIRPRHAKEQSTGRAWTALVVGSIVIVAVFLTARFTLEPRTSETILNPPMREYGSLAGWLPYQSRIFALYLKNIFLPTELSAYYSPLKYGGVPFGWALIANAVALSSLVLMAWRNKLALLGVILLGAGLAAVSNLVPIYNPLADRYLYLPLAGGCWMIAGTLSGLGKSRFARSAWGVLIAVVFVSLAVQNQIRQSVFQNERTLWSDTARKSPKAYLPFSGLGWAAYSEGNYAQSLEYFGIALENCHDLDPDSWAGAALCLKALGQTNDAEQAYREAVARQPRFRNPRLIQKAFLWRRAYVDQLATIARPTGLWIENELSNQNKNEPKL